MSAATEKVLRANGIAPWEVGVKDAVVVVGIQGEITAKDDGTITIAGVTLPTRLSDTVRHLSMMWPESDDDSAESFDDEGPWADDYREAVAQMESLIEEVDRAHLSEGHTGAFRYCTSPFCVAANGGAS